MSASLIAELERLVAELAEQPQPAESVSLARLAEQVAGCFQVKPDEVAILVLVRAGRSLQFLLPEQLQRVGTIPINSATALAARTARDKRAEVVNSFAAARHASVFEGVPLGRRHGEPIHKIMSAPIVVEDKTLGVVQISRKGRSSIDSGPDFTAEDLRELVRVAPVLGRFLQLCQVS